jgi:hypothetical protein
MRPAASGGSNRAGNSIFGIFACDQWRAPDRTGLRRRQSKINYYAVLGRKTRSFAPEIMSSNRLIRSSQHGWKWSGRGMGSALGIEAAMDISQPDSCAEDGPGCGNGFKFLLARHQQPPSNLREESQPVIRHENEF